MGRPPVRPVMRLGSARARGATAERLDLGVPIRLEAWLNGPRDGLPEEPLDAAQEVGFVDRDEAHGVAARAGPASPPDPMDVVVGLPRQLEVDDMGEILDIEAAGRDVRRDEDAHGS